MRQTTAPFLLAFFASTTASAQVLITEVQPNPPEGADTGEYIELHNTSTVSVSIEGWTLNDYAGMTPTGEATNRWAFPALAALAPGQVIVVARQAAQFMANNMGMRPTYELADGMDDAMVPNLTGTMGTSVMQLVNGATGDAVVLRDELGTLVDGVEYGTVDRSVPGIPQAEVPGDNPLESLVRVAVTGSSISDFRVASPSPFTGFGGTSGPVIVRPTVTPPHLRYDGTMTVRTAVTDTAGVNTVDIYLATATSSSGDAVQNYVSIAMTSSVAPTYTFEAPLNNLGPGLAPAAPASFHALYVRGYVQAENDDGQTGTDPVGAVETADNSAYHQRNVMPVGPSPIAEVREQNASQAPVWVGHSATVRGVALVKNGVLSPNRLDVAIEDESGYAIRVFHPDPSTIELNPGDLVEAVGTISQFRGVMQLSGEVSVTPVGGTGDASPTELTIAQLLADAERYESRLVSIKDLEFVQPTASWPGMGTGGNVTVRDDSGEITVRITSGTDLFGTEAPQYGFDLVGVAGQFTSETDGTMGGYQVLPRSVEDVVAHAAPPPPPDAGFPDSGVVPGRDGGTSGRDAGTVDTGTGGTGGTEDSGCGCSTSEGADRGALGLLGGLLVLGLAIARRRR